MTQKNKHSNLGNKNAYSSFNIVEENRNMKPLKPFPLERMKCPNDAPFSFYLDIIPGVVPDGQSSWDVAMGMHEKGYGSLPRFPEENFVPVKDQHASVIGIKSDKVGAVKLTVHITEVKPGQISFSVVGGMEKTAGLLDIECIARNLNRIELLSAYYARQLT